MEIALAIATVLGGLAAILYFIERWRSPASSVSSLLPDLPLVVRESLQAALGAAQDVLACFPASTHQWHNAGHIVPDEEASDAKAWLSEFEDPRGHVVYGPYVTLKRARSYNAWFRLRFEAADGDSPKHTLRLEVTHGGRHDVHLVDSQDNDGRYRLYKIGFLYLEIGRAHV